MDRVRFRVLLEEFEVKRIYVFFLVLLALIREINLFIIVFCG